MKEYKRLTKWEFSNCASVNGLSPIDKDLTNAINRLAELEDKIENGTLVFIEKPKKKYYAIVGYRNCYGKFGWNIHYVPIEYEKEYNRVSLNIDGRLFVTTKDLLFNTKAEAEVKLKELKELKGEV